MTMLEVKLPIANDGHIVNEVAIISSDLPLLINSLHIKREKQLDNYLEEKRQDTA